MAVQRGRPPVEFTVDQQDIQSLGRALKAEADGKALRKELIGNLREAMEPIKEQARSNLLSIATAGLTQGEPLRTTIASQMKTDVRLSGRMTGVRLRVRRKNMPRGFVNAPKALNTPKGWRHKVYGRDVFVDQVATPTEWFDRAHRDKGRRQEVVEAVRRAVREMADRIAQRAG